MNFFPAGALEAWVTSDRKAPLATWMTEEEKETHGRIFAADAGGYRRPTNWYRALVRNLNEEDEKEANLDPNLECPVLVIEEAPSEYSSGFW
jgi:soluble epoxide hydrolase / lipid-phosphate phosphatase